MKKNEFIKKLRNKLHVLQSSEVDEIIDEYSDHIAQKVANGKSEEEAIKDFGDLDELADEILSAYHIKKPAKTLEDYFNTLMQFINNVTGEVLHLTSKQAVNFIVEFVILLVVIFLIRIALSLLIKGIGGILGFVTLGIFTPLAWLLNFLFGFAYFLISIYIIYLFLKRKLFDKEGVEDPIIVTEVQVEKTKEKSSQSKNRSEKAYFSAPDYKKEVTKPEVEPVEVKEVQNVVAKTPPVVQETKKKEKKNSESGSFGSSASDLLMFLVRLVLGIFLWLPAFCVLLGAIVAFGIVVSLVVLGFKFIWLLFIVFGGILICLAFVLPLSKLIWGKTSL